MYAALIFDFDNTLVDFDESEKVAITSYFAKQGILNTHNRNVIISTFLKVNTHYWGQRNALGIEAVFSKTIAEVFRLLFPTLTPPQNCGQTYLQEFEHAAILESGARELIIKIAPLYPLFIVSNGLKCIQRKRIETIGLVQYFKDILVSGDVGFAKPQPEIFELLIAKHGLQKEGLLYIGDSLRDDYYGSKNAEIKFCFYNRQQRDYVEQVDHQINDLRALLPLLGIA